MAKIGFNEYLEDSGESISIRVDFDDSENPIEISADFTEPQWISLKDANSIIKAINRAKKILRSYGDHTLLKD